ncbi:MAG: glycosyltransferase [Candidatus Omnitrophica bacterium]|nr:glycosyltransferase [Candidatus Omnitrophota bacterium]
MKPLVSVVIPTYNCADLLERSVKSVLAQTFQDFEIIIVDDASADNTQEVVFSFKDTRIKYVRHKKNLGEAAARNTGIKIAQGEYIAPQDSDDEWLPEKLEKQLNAFKNSSSLLGVVYTGFWKIRGDKKNYLPSVNIKAKERNIYNILLKSNFIGTPTTLIKKACFEKSGLFDERLFHLVDWDLWIRISRFYHFKYIAEPLVNSYYREQCVSDNEKAFISAVEIILKKNFEELKRSSRLLSYYYYTLGRGLCNIREFERGKEYLTQAVKLYPFCLKYDFCALCALAGEKKYKAAVAYLYNVRKRIKDILSNLINDREK